VTRQEYDLKGNLVAITDAAGHVTRQTYSDRGVPQTRTDPLGCVTRYTFDSDGRLLEERDAVGLVAKSTYDANGNVLSRTVAQPPPSEAPQLTTFFAYDAVGRPTRTTEPDGAVTQVRYSAAGEETEREDPLGRVTRREYDAFGRPYRTFFPDQTYTEQSFDAEGRLVAERDRAGRLTRYTLNGEGRITAVEFPDGTRTAHSWDAAGRLVATVDAAGATTHYAYDAAGRRTKVTDALGRVTRFGYDAVGNVVSVVDPAGRTTRYEYDALDRRVRTLFPDGTETRTAYDAVGNKVLEVDAEGRETRFSYDCRGRLTGVQDPAGGLTTYTYDARNLRTSMTDAAGRTTRYVYDSRGREVSRILPTGEADTRVYDAAGNLVQRTGFGGASTHFSYDTNDRLVERSRPDGTSVRFTYTATGRRLSAVDARGTTHYTYDARDRLLKVEQPGAGALSYAYEARGQRTRLAAQVGGEEYVTTYSYDAVGRLAGVVDDLGRPYALGYDANGNRASLAYPNGVTTRYGYDTRNRLTQLTSSRADGQVVQGYTFTLSGAGQRMRVDEVDGTTHTYTYDSLRRLTSETVVGPAGAYQHAFVYDAVGNRIRQVRTEAGGMTTREATFDTRDRVLSEGDTAFGWNADGQLTSRSGSEEAGFEWDFEERLRRVVHADGRVTEHVYDADGNRVELRETPAGGGPVRVTRYLVDTAGPLSHVVAELDASGQVRAHYTRADDELLAVLRPGGSRFFHADGVGSVRRLTDETGFVTDAYRFSAFGELREHTGADPNTYRFAGEPVDPNTGFSFNRARWLNPQAGQFVSMDPYAGTLADPPSLHRYLYAHADPVNNVDPTGQFAVPASIVNLSISVSVAAMSCYNGLLAAFRTGGPAVGRAFQAFGALAERTAQTVIRTWNPNAVTQGLHIAGRHIDNVLRIGNRIMMLEVKYSLPRAGDALTRLTAQANAMLTHPGVASGRAQAVVWSYKEPTQAAMRDVLSALGPAASRVQFVHGVEGLYRYLVLYFGNGPF
jgi:RHS repeat-associated protein